MKPNRATIYSNGIADFQRLYAVTSERPLSISIPVRQQHLADVLASLTVSGNVHVVRPPSFQPANQDETDVAIAPDAAFTDLAHQLSGSEVELTLPGKKVAGKLVGTQDQETGTSGEPITEQFIVLWNEDGLARHPVRLIENLQFTDPTIRSEIDKALHRQLREIKPNSTFIELELSTNRKTAYATLQYTIPAAAWKISYRVLIGKDGKLELHGHAIVDNNTDEDWNNFIVSIVMGQPITFSTDLADSKTPRRNHVNVVQESALGNIEIENAMERLEDSDQYAAEESMGAMCAAPMPRRMSGTSPATRSAAAKTDLAEVTEIGDFCIFESSTPVSIAAHRSAIIAVFVTALDDSKAVLHYKTENHASNPFRAIQFRNSAKHSLGRGVCTVYTENAYAGNCILPVTPAGTAVLLPHALETAVRVHHEAHKIESRRVRVKIAAGMVQDHFHKLQRTEYTIHSHRDEPLPLVLDHARKLQAGEILCQAYRGSEEPVELNLKKLSDGYRAEILLPPRDVLKIVLVETCVVQSSIRLCGEVPSEGDLRVGWLVDNLIESNMSLAQEPEIRRIIELQRIWQERNHQILHAQEEFKRLNARQVRLRENIKAGVGDHQLTRWQDDLARCEDNIVQVEEQHLPQLVSARDLARRELHDALYELSLDWSE